MPLNISTAMHSVQKAKKPYFLPRFSAAAMPSYTQVHAYPADVSDISISLEIGFSSSTISILI